MYLLGASSPEADRPAGAGTARLAADIARENTAPVGEGTARAAGRTRQAVGMRPARAAGMFPVRVAARTRLAADTRLVADTAQRGPCTPP